MLGNTFFGFVHRSSMSQVKMSCGNKAGFVAIFLLFAVISLHEINADEATDSIMDAINKASKDLPGGMKINVMGGDDMRKMAGDAEDEDTDEADDDEAAADDDLGENVRTIKIDKISPGGEHIKIGGDGKWSQTSGEQDDEDDEDDDDDQTYDEFYKLDEKTGTPEEEEAEAEEEYDMSKIGVETENGVAILKDSNFADFVFPRSEKGPVLVEFYAPWCGHCKTLAPEYEKAAKRLKNLKNPVYLAKVDATEEKEIAEKYEVTGYPTLKWFRDGQPYEYDGPREADGIFEFMKKRSGADWKPPPLAVVALTTENFTDFINGYDLSLVEFYAPWCGHCKKLAPEYEQAAQRLQELSIPLAKVDATAEPDLGKQYDVTGYPTLKIFRRGKQFEYKGERNQAGIESYMISQRGDPSYVHATLKGFKKDINGKEATVAGFFESDKDFKYLTYLEAANEMRDDNKFIHTFNASIRDQFKINLGSVVVYRGERFHTKYEPKQFVMEIKEDTTPEEIRAHVAAHDKPLVGQYTPPGKPYQGRPLVLFFYTVDFSFDGIKATQIWRNKIAGIANEFRGLTFAIADEEENKDMFKQFGFEESGEEMNVGVLGEKDRKYPMEPVDGFDVDEITAFLKSFQDGKAKSIVKSAPAPKKQGLVKVVVGNTFQKLVMDPKKDVLIELYAPWCGHCKKLEPIYKKLAKKFKADKNLVIAKMDATANDAPEEYSSTGFPTIYFAPAGDKLNPVKMDGGRELTDFENFLNEHATVSLGKGGEKQEL